LLHLHFFAKKIIAFVINSEKSALRRRKNFEGRVGPSEVVRTRLKFRHMMIKEIFEEPKVTTAFLAEGVKQIQEISDAIGSKRHEMVYITGSGTSYHAGLAAQYAFSTLTRFITSLIPASEFPSWVPSKPTRRSLLIAISQSGESSDILAAATVALEKDMDVLAITNTQDSSLMKMSQYTLLTRAGEELAVTATKSYIAQLMALFLLSVEFAEAEGTRATDTRQLRQQLFRAPRVIAETMNSLNDNVRQLAREYRRQNFFFLLGSGPNYATALEGALKLKEACNIFAEGFASREFLHGPIQLVSKNTSLFFILNEDQLTSAISEIRSVRAFDASVLSIFGRKDEQLEAVSNELICVPEGFPKVFSSMIYIIPLQLFAYHSSVARGLNPDKPEKLTKVVKSK
jgi:glucosamine--fructose-6-phosphate aminotransferase (isomerizing)